jgi:hypothetical protein
MGVVELGYVVAHYDTGGGFLLVVAGCVALMWPQVVGWAKRRPKTGVTEGE